jgi:hypothetical protein
MPDTFYFTIAFRGSQAIAELPLPNCRIESCISWTPIPQFRNSAMLQLPSLPPRSIEQ